MAKENQPSNLVLNFLEPSYWSYSPPIDQYYQSAWGAHIPFLFCLTALHKPKTFVELGTHRGLSFNSFCFAAKRLRLDTKAFAVDPWQSDEQAGLYANTTYNAFVKDIHPYTDFAELKRMPFEEALHSFKSNSIDLLHIDGLHTFEAAKNIFETCLPKMSKRGVILFHNTNVYSDDFSVWKFWNDISKKYPHFNFLHGHGLGVLYVGENKNEPILQLLQELNANESTENLYQLHFQRVGEELCLKNITREKEKKAANNFQISLDKQKNQKTKEVNELKAVANKEKSELANSIINDANIMIERMLKVSSSRNWLFKRYMKYLKYIPRDFSRKLRGKPAPKKKIPIKNVHLINSADYLPSMRRDGLATTIFKQSVFAYPKEKEFIKAPESFVVVPDAVDIIICIHNALDDVKRCLESILAHTTNTPYNLILVDDGSKAETADYLKSFSKNRKNTTLLRSDVATGYTFAANRGLQASREKWSLLLNSDTIVTDNWLHELLAVAQKNSNIGIVGPLSNTASWQSVPKLTENGDWADNDLINNMTPNDMAKLCYQTAVYQDIELPFINGFCMLISQNLIDEIGYFDEDTFAAGYGEENDFCIRARKAGYQLKVSLRSYVYHAQSKSYGNDRRHKLASDAHQKLISKHDPELHIVKQVENCKNNLILNSMRGRLDAAIKNFSSLTKVKHKLLSKIAFLLPTNTIGGGSNVIIQEALALQSKGVNVTLINLRINKERFDRSYPNLPFKMVYLPQTDDYPKLLTTLAHDYDALIATHNSTIYWLPEQDLIPSCAMGYYIQDYEPYFYDPDSIDYKLAEASYTKDPKIHLFTKTNWNADIIYEKHKVKPTVIGCSVDTHLFKPNKNTDLTSQAEKPIRIVAMVRFDGNNERRSPSETIEILQHAIQKFGTAIECYIFGTDDLEINHRNIALNGIVNLGLISSNQCAFVLSECDIFLDFSKWQAMGLTAMEAMACGCAVVLPKSGGTLDFSVHDHNSILIDSGNIKEAIQALEKLIVDHDFRNTIRQQAAFDMGQYSPIYAANKIIDILS